MQVEWSLSRYGLKKKDLDEGERQSYVKHLITAMIRCKNSPQWSAGSPRCPECMCYEEAMHLQGSRGDVRATSPATPPAGTWCEVQRGVRKRFLAKE